jgi:hypothetical protein
MACPHLDRPSHALGMCAACYFRFYRKQRKALGRTVRKRGERPRGSITFDELYAKALRILPNASMEMDEDGQLLICTNLRKGPDGYLKDMGGY